jgi:deoxyribodipyrimidine photo-lyase
VTAEAPSAAGPFEPTLAAAMARLAAVNLDHYARARNFLDGPVTRLSPYVTHGLLTLPEVLRAVHARRPLGVRHKFVYELAWREYFRHVWWHEGDGIFESLHGGPLPEDAYARVVPVDVLEARTGVPVVDTAVRELYDTGWLHNHARMWVASYVVHLRRVHWRAGADWLYAHLLDGDLASNHLSWQWVAGTASAKPYLFNAANVATYAPPAWHSFGTAVDASYEALDAVARGGAVPAHLPLPEGRSRCPLVVGTPPADLGFAEPDPALVRGRPVQLVHPWSLGAPPSGLPAEALTIAVVAADAHRRWPWSERRWRFVGARLAALTPHRWHADAAELRAALDGAASIHGIADPHLPAALRALTLTAPSRLFRDPERRCDSFSRFWSRVTEGVTAIDALTGDAR